MSEREIRHSRLTKQTKNTELQYTAPLSTQGKNGDEKMVSLGGTKYHYRKVNGAWLRTVIESG